MDKKVFVLGLLLNFLIARQEFITMHCSLDSNISKKNFDHWLAYII